MIKSLPVEEYRAVYEPGRVECKTTETMRPTEEIIGQERAQKALRFGLEIQERGFNIYVAGMPGTGRRTAVRNFLDELAKTKPKADDWVYVNNFANPYEPLAIRLPPGMSGQRRRTWHSLSRRHEQPCPVHSTVMTIQKNGQKRSRKSTRSGRISSVRSMKVRQNRVFRSRSGQPAHHCSGH